MVRRRTAVPLVLVATLTSCAAPPDHRKAAPAVGAVVPTTDAAGEPVSSMHPLKHPEFRIITAPHGTWNARWMYLNQVMSYLLKSPRDAALARRALAEYGLGRGDRSYLFIARAGTPIVVNGNLFKTREQAATFVRKERLSRLLYVSENNAFPTQIPVWLDEEGIRVWVLKWQR